MGTGSRLQEKLSQVARSAIRQWQQARSPQPAAQVAPAPQWQLTRSGTVPGRPRSCALSGPAADRRSPDAAGAAGGTTPGDRRRCCPARSPRGPARPLPQLLRRGPVPLVTEVDWFSRRTLCDHFAVRNARYVHAESVRRGIESIREARGARPGRTAERWRVLSAQSAGRREPSRGRRLSSWLAAWRRSAGRRSPPARSGCAERPG